MTAGFYPGLAAAAKMRVKNEIEPLQPQLLKENMFIAFSKNSPCLSWIKEFGPKVSAIHKNGGVNTILQVATKEWSLTKNKRFYT